MNFSGIYLIKKLTMPALMRNFSFLIYFFSSFNLVFPSIVFSREFKCIGGRVKPTYGRLLRKINTYYKMSDGHGVELILCLDSDREMRVIHMPTVDSSPILSFELEGYCHLPGPISTTGYVNPPEAVKIWRFASNEISCAK